MGGFKGGSSGFKVFLNVSGVLCFGVFSCPGPTGKQECYVSNELKVLGSGVLGSHGFGLCLHLDASSDLHQGVKGPRRWHLGFNLGQFAWSTLLSRTI